MFEYKYFFYLPILVFSFSFVFFATVFVLIVVGDGKEQQSEINKREQWKEKKEGGGCNRYRPHFSYCESEKDYQKVFLFFSVTPLTTF